MSVAVDKGNDLLRPAGADSVRQRSWLPAVCAAAAFVCFVYAVIVSLHWPLFHDAAIMHYVVFLMDHGWRPYADIVDINMPGSYMVEWFAVHVFGSGPTAWRAFDIVTMLVTISAAACIPRRAHRWAGLLGGLAVAIFHLQNGPADVGERDWSLMVLLLTGFAFYVHAIRSHRPALLFFFAVLSGFAAAIKPPAFPLPVALFLLACFVVRGRKHESLRPYLWSAFAGALVPVFAVGIFLHHYHALHAFLRIARGLVPFYAASSNQGWFFLLRVALGVYLLAIALLAGAICRVNQSWRAWETQAIALGVAFGAFLYLSQRKGWQQHKETLFAFLLLFIAVQCSEGLRSNKGFSRAGSMLGLCLLTFTLFNWARPIRHYTWTMAAPEAIQKDLAAVGGAELSGPGLSGDVQCVEMVTGCINALYNQRLLPATGFLFDSFLFSPRPTAAIGDLRARFLDELERRPPRVLILGASDWEAAGFSYDRVRNWPAFGSFLARDYMLEHDFNPAGVIDRGSYRLYVRD